MSIASDFGIVRKGYHGQQTECPACGSEAHAHYATYRGASKHVKGWFWWRKVEVVSPHLEMYCTGCGYRWTVPPKWHCAPQN